MNLEETARVLAWSAAFDRRTVGETDVRAWHEAVGDLDVGEALAAVTRWYRDRSDWLMPSHLREAVRLVRADRRTQARIAALEAAAEQAPSPAEEATRRSWADLPSDVQERLAALSKGHLERFPMNGHELVGERFLAQLPTPPPTRPRSLYGDD